MANDSKKQVMPNSARTNPSVDPKTGKVNPSAPTTGTEGGGNTADERKTLSDMEPSSAGPINNVQHREPHDDSHLNDNQAAMSRRTTNEGSTNQTTEFAMNTSHGGNDRTFRCADAGNADCRWETSGTDTDIMDRAREHARIEHGWHDWTEVMQSRVRDAIRERRAA